MTGTIIKASWNGPQAIRSAQHGLETGVRVAADHLLALSSDVVPIEEGTLQDSGAVTVEGPVAAVSYDTPYAVKQHEELGYKHDAGRRAKYLEGPLEENRKELQGIIAKQVQNALK